MNYDTTETITPAIQNARGYILGAVTATKRALKYQSADIEEVGTITLVIALYGRSPVSGQMEWFLAKTMPAGLKFYPSVLRKPKTGQPTSTRKFFEAAFNADPFDVAVAWGFGSTKGLLEVVNNWTYQNSDGVRTPPVFTVTTSHKLRTGDFPIVQVALSPAPTENPDGSPIAPLPPIPDEIASLNLVEYLGWTDKPRTPEGDIFVNFVREDQGSMPDVQAAPPVNVGIYTPTATQVQAAPIAEAPVQVTAPAQSNNLAFAPNGQPIIAEDANMPF